MDNMQNSLLWETVTDKLYITLSSLELFIPTIQLGA